MQSALKVYKKATCDPATVTRLIELEQLSESTHCTLLEYHSWFVEPSAYYPPTSAT